MQVRGSRGFEHHNKREECYRREASHVYTRAYVCMSTCHKNFNTTRAAHTLDLPAPSGTTTRQEYVFVSSLPAPCKHQGLPQLQQPLQGRTGTPEACTVYGKHHHHHHTRVNMSRRHVSSSSHSRCVSMFLNTPSHCPRPLPTDTIIR